MPGFELAIVVIALALAAVPAFRGKKGNENNSRDSLNQEKVSNTEK
ncbi:MAG: hypothetical protein ACFFB3_06705 [Candidatus Hodarchaeota archaeon]